MKKIFNFILFTLLKNLIDFIIGMIPSEKPDPAVFKSVKIIAHRGIKGSSNIKENTIDAFNIAINTGAHGIEFDLQLTNDNIPVVSHDTNLKRVFGINIEIAEKKYDEIKNRFPCILTFEDIIKYYKDILFFIEVKKQKDDAKDKKLAEEVINLIDQYNIKSRCKIITLSYELIKYYIDEDNLDVYPIYLFTPKNAIVFRNKYNLPGIYGAYYFTSKKLVEIAKKEGYVIGTGFINYKNTMYRQINKRVGYLFSDRIDKILN